MLSCSTLNMIFDIFTLDRPTAASHTPQDGEQPPSPRWHGDIRVPVCIVLTARICWCTRWDFSLLQLQQHALYYWGFSISSYNKPIISILLFWSLQAKQSHRWSFYVSLLAFHFQGFSWWNQIIGSFRCKNWVFLQKYEKSGIHRPCLAAATATVFIKSIMLRE